MELSGNGAYNLYRSSLDSEKPILIEYNRFSFIGVDSKNGSTYEKINILKVQYLNQSEMVHEG